MSRRVSHLQVQASLSREIDHINEAAMPPAVDVRDDPFDSLNPVEQSAASLGVSPLAWKPIGFLNTKHYEQLVKANALDDTLARRIEAYRVVSSGS